jgi:hypothetical protein
MMAWVKIGLVVPLSGPFAQRRPAEEQQAPPGANTRPPPR